MRIVAIADTHGNHRTIDGLPDGDVLVHAGDFTDFGSGRDDFLEWFEDQPFNHRILVLGNHEDGSLSSLSKQKLEAELEQREPIDYIGFSPVEIDGVTFGSDAEQNLDVLVTHLPPEGILDRKPPEGAWNQSGTGRSAGSAKKRQLVEEVQPDLHVFGHVHSAYGRTTIDGTTYVNCALAGPDYEPINDPMVIDL